MDGKHLVTRLDRNAKAIPKALGRLQRQCALFFYHAANVVRKPTIGIRYKTRALKDDNLGLLVESAQTCRRRCAARDASNDNHLHS